ncbi:MAG: PilZ domain-containing protein, partial [Myxococcota bacterium]
MIRIRHLEASRRKHARAREGLAVESGGERLEVVDWSVGGVRVAALPRALPSGTDVPLTLGGMVDGVRRTFETRARVARGDEGGVVLEFGSLSGVGRELLAALSGGGAAPDTVEGPESPSPLRASEAPPLREAERATLAPAPAPR